MNNQAGNEPNPDCSTSRVAPVLDTIFAIGNLAGAIYYSTRKDLSNRDSLMSFAGLWTGAHIGSAYYGYSNTSECAEGRPETFDRPELLDPDYRPPPKKKKRSGPLVPEPGVMRSN